MPIDAHQTLHSFLLEYLTFRYIGVFLQGTYPCGIAWLFCQSIVNILKISLYAVKQDFC